MSLAKPAFALLALPAFLLAPAGSTPSPRSLVITHVTLIDTNGMPAMTDMSVEVRGRRIASVTPAATMHPSAEAQVVDGTGKFLIPGLWDMHVHTGPREFLALYVANGVTGVRDMGGDLEEPTGSSSARYVQLNLWREAIEDGTLLGPRMVLAGFLIDGVKWPGNIAAANADEGRQAVGALARLGVDFIKVKSFLPRDTYLAIAAEARRRHFVLAGHVPTSVRAAEASDVGHRSIEHLSGVALGCSAAEARLMGEMAAAFAARDRDRYGRAESRSAEMFEPSMASALFARFARNGTWQVPTLVELRRDALGRSTGEAGDGTPGSDPRWRYIPASLRERWSRELGPATGEAGRNRFADDLSLARRMHEAGVPFMAGTDSANPSVLPGFSLHDELKLLVKAGFSPLAALQAATLNPARYLGRDGELGTIEVGKLADLVLLYGNPLEDISNTERIEAVVVNGRYLDREDLDAELRRVEAAAR